jgi:alpha-galactosidase
MNTSATRRFVAALLTVATLPALALASAEPAAALDNGLAVTPPMGWNDWNAFACNVNEDLVKQTADAMVSNSMRDAGYTYVNIDDCWMTSTRDRTGVLVADPAKFPSGMRALADYVHARGLKLGIYEDAGRTTCAGYPGSLGHEVQDAKTFASWKIDYLKYDNCNNDGTDVLARYTAMGNALAKSGRRIVFSICNWGEANPWNWAPPVGNLWRTTGDIGDNWDSMNGIYHSNVSHAFAAAPNAWNDPDMLEVGNGGMTDVEYRTHFTLWAAMAAPLLAGTDLRNASASTLAIYLNKDLIAIDQDRLGEQGRQIFYDGARHVLVKRLANGDRAVVLFNSGDSAATISTSANAAGMPAASSYTLTDLWSKEVIRTTGPISATVPAHGTVSYRLHGGSGSGGRTRILVNQAAVRCLDLPASVTTNGTGIVIWDCHGDTNQEWTTTAAGEVQAFGKCLNAAGSQTTPGTKVEIQDCDGGTSQQWKIHSDGTITGVASGLCLDITGTDNGATLMLATCDQGANQKWTRR